MAIFWTALCTLLCPSRSVEVALAGVGSSMALEILFGGMYGKFSDWFRSRFEIAGNAFMARSENQ